MLKIYFTLKKRRKQLNLLILICLKKFLKNLIIKKYFNIHKKKAIKINLNNNLKNWFKFNKKTIN